MYGLKYLFVLLDNKMLPDSMRHISICDLSRASSSQESFVLGLISISFNLVMEVAELMTESIMHLWSFWKMVQNPQWQQFKGWL